MDTSSGDLYDDLESIVFHRADEPEKKTREELGEHVRKVEDMLVAAFDKIAIMKLHIKDLQEENNYMKINSASLLATSQTQIQQKNHIVTVMQKQLQFYKKRLNNTSEEGGKKADKDWKVEEVKLVEQFPKFSFKELCDELSHSFQKEKENQNSPSPKDWHKKFHYQNFSCYFFSHGRNFSHEPVTDIQYFEDANTSTKPKAGSRSPKPTADGPSPVKGKSGSPKPTADGRSSMNAKSSSRSRSPKLAARGRSPVKGRSKSKEGSPKGRSRSPTGRRTRSPKTSLGRIGDDRKKRRSKSRSPKPVGRGRSPVKGRSKSKEGNPKARSRSPRSPAGRRVRSPKTSLGRIGDDRKKRSPPPRYHRRSGF